MWSKSGIPIVCVRQSTTVCVRHCRPKLTFISKNLISILKLRKITFSFIRSTYFNVLFVVWERRQRCIVHVFIWLHHARREWINRLPRNVCCWLPWCRRISKKVSHFKLSNDTVHWKEHLRPLSIEFSDRHFFFYLYSFEEAFDDYSSIMVKALADRLAEVRDRSNHSSKHYLDRLNQVLPVTQPDVI